MLIVLSGTESNRRIKFHPRLARFNPRLALIGFPGAGARPLLKQKYRLVSLWLVTSVVLERDFCLLDFPAVSRLASVSGCSTPETAFTRVNPVNLSANHCLKFLEFHVLLAHGRSRTNLDKLRGKPLKHIVHNSKAHVQYRKYRKQNSNVISGVN